MLCNIINFHFIFNDSNFLLEDINNYLSEDERNKIDNLRNEEDNKDYLNHLDYKYFQNEFEKIISSKLKFIYIKYNMLYIIGIAILGMLQIIYIYLCFRLFKIKTWKWILDPEVQNDLEIQKDSEVQKEVQEDLEGQLPKI